MPSKPANPIDAYAPRPGLIPESNPPESGPRCMEAILAPIGAGLEKYSGLGGHVLLAYNNAMPEFSTSASIGLEGGNFPPNIVGGFHIHEGKKSNAYIQVLYLVLISFSNELMHHSFCTTYQAQVVAILGLISS